MLARIPSYLHIQECRRRGAAGEEGTRRREGTPIASLEIGAEVPSRDSVSLSLSSASVPSDTVMSGTCRWLISPGTAVLWSGTSVPSALALPPTRQLPTAPAQPPLDWHDRLLDWHNRLLDWHNWLSY